MRALLDMPVCRTLLSVLEADGHEGIHACEIGLDRAPDRKVLAIARSENRLSSLPTWTFLGSWL